MNKRSFIAVGALVSCLCLSSMVHAAWVVNASVGGGPVSGMNYVTFDNMSLGPDGWVENGLTLTLEPDAQVVQGSESGQYAAPVLSNGNGALFGTGDGPDETKYVTSGNNSGDETPNASATMTFGSNQWYFGLLWGSVDTYNKLEFYDSADNLLYTLTGSSVKVPADGDQSSEGTVYANIFADTPFTKVVATSTQYAFEFDNVAYGVPEPAAMLVWGFLGIVGLCWLRRRKA